MWRNIVAYLKQRNMITKVDNLYVAMMLDVISKDEMNNSNMKIFLM